MIDSIGPTGILCKYIQNYFIVETYNSIDFMPKKRVYPSGNAIKIIENSKGQIKTQDVAYEVCLGKNGIDNDIKAKFKKD
jgi:hypothetical protein